MMQYVVNEIGYHFISQSPVQSDPDEIAIQFPFSVLLLCSALKTGLSCRRLQHIRGWNEIDFEHILSAAKYFHQHPGRFPLLSRAMAVSFGIMQIYFHSVSFQLMELKVSLKIIELKYSLPNAGDPSVVIVTPEWVIGNQRYLWERLLPRIIIVMFDCVHGQLDISANGVPGNILQFSEEQWMNRMIDLVYQITKQ